MPSALQLKSITGQGGPGAYPISVFLALTGLHTRLLVYRSVWERGGESKSQTDKTGIVQSQKERAIRGEEGLIGMPKEQC